MKKFKSVTESVSFSAEALLGKGAISQETSALLKELALATPDTKEEVARKIQESLSSRAKKDLESLGATLPSDVVQVNLDLGSFLYDVYEKGARKPEAPLAKMAYQRHMMELSARLEREEIELTDEERGVIMMVLNDDDKWRKVSGHAHVKVTKDGKEEKTGITLSNQGLVFFTQVLNAAVAIFEEKNESTKEGPVAEAK